MKLRSSNGARAVALAMIAGTAVSAFGGVAAPITAIYTKIPTSPTSIVPGALDLAGMPVVTNFRAMEQLTISPDGSRWLLTSRNQLGGDLETQTVMGTSATGNMFLQEGQPVPAGVAGELIDFFGSGVGRFNDNNEIAFSLRARGGVASVFQKVLYWNGSTFTLPIQMGATYTGLSDNPPGNAGNETVGNSIGSIHLLNDGRIGSQDSTIGNIATAFRPACAYNLAGFRQSSVSVVTGLNGIGTETVSGIGGNAFYTTTSGAHWGFIGDISRPAGFTNAIIVDDLVVMRQQQVMPGSTNTFFDGTALGAYGNAILVRGQAGLTTATGAFAWRSTDGLMIETGDAIVTPPTVETWIGTSFNGFSGNTNGDYVLTGKTSAAEASNDVVVLNGTTVIVREGDPVDIDGDGDTADDDAFLGRGINTNATFIPDSVFVTNDGWLYFIANIRNAAGVDYQSSPSFGTPNAFLRVRAFVPPPPVCPGDANGDGQINIADLSVVLASFGGPASGPSEGDFNNDGQCDIADLSVLLAQFGNSCA